MSKLRKIVNDNRGSVSAIADSLLFLSLVLVPPNETEGWLFTAILLLIFVISLVFAINKKENKILIAIAVGTLAIGVIVAFLSWSVWGVLWSPSA